MKNVILKYFIQMHLRHHNLHLQTQFHDFAITLEHMIPDSAEKTTMFRKLLEAEDCAMRAMTSEE